MSVSVSHKRGEKTSFYCLCLFFFLCSHTPTNPFTHTHAHTIRSGLFQMKIDRAGDSIELFFFLSVCRGRE